jgi:alanine dehydrogenase
VTLEHALLIADLGFEKAVKRNEALRRGVNVHEGRVWHVGVAEAFGIEAAAL